MKNKFRIFTVAFLACMLILVSNVSASTNSNYYDNQEISTGLKSMARGELNITLNGDYTVNGVTFNSGTSYVLKVSGAKIIFNGVSYDSISFIPKNPLTTIKIVSGSSSYLGTMTFKVDSSSGTSKVMPINTVYIEDYLKGVVGKEMSDDYPIEALKAQAVAARNYALSNRKHKSEGFDLCDTICCQVYGGYNASLKNVIAAVNATKGILLLSETKNGTSIVGAFYSASNGGYTEDSGNVWPNSITYLKAKVDVYDGYDINYSWEKKYTDSELNNLYRLNPRVQPTDTFVKIDLSTITKYDSGRIENISLIFKNSLGTQYALSYNKEAARTFLNFKSAMYTVSYDATSRTNSFKGNGYGHGVGMSQIGARNRANAGQSFGDILKFYYDSTTLIDVLPSINSISVDKDRIYNLDYPNFSVNATGGSGKGLTYRYVVERNNAAIYSGEFVSTSKFQYNPKEVGSYTLKVYVKDIDSIVLFEDTKTYNFDVKEEVPPTGITATSGYNNILLKWNINAVNDTSGYEVYRATSSTGTYALISTTTEKSYNNTGLTMNDIYYYKVRAYRMEGTAKRYSSFSTTINSKPLNVQRLSGVNRIQTSIAIAKEQYTDSAPDAVVLATANNFPDALAGSGLAYKYNAPLLLVDTTVSNSKSVLDYITANLVGNKNIYVLGGEGVVSKAIADYLITKGYNIIRLEGKDRYQTNQEIVDYMKIAKGTNIVIATGNSFPDALSISSIAAIKGFPILLNGKDTLLPNVSNDIANIQPTTVYLIGDIGVLSTNIETQIKHLNSNTEIVRLGGLTRYDTSMKILDYFNLNTITVSVATGLNFPDALSGSVLAARRNCGVLLVDNKDVTKQKALLSKQNITNTIVFGGADVVSNNIAAWLIQK